MLCSFSSVAAKDIEICDKGSWKNEQKKAGSLQNELALGAEPVSFGSISVIRNICPTDKLTSNLRV